jgi:hypothetical protein
MKTPLPKEFMATTGLYYMENGMQLTIQPGTHLFQIPSAVNAITPAMESSPMYNLPSPPQASPSYFPSPGANFARQSVRAV